MVGTLPTPCGEGDASGSTDQGVTDDAIAISTIADPGAQAAPGLNLGGQSTPPASPHRFLEKEGRLILRLSGQPTVELVVETP